MTQKRQSDQRGFSLLEMTISLAVVLLAMTGLFSMLIHNSRVNKAQQMTAEAQANARNCLSMIVQELRSAGWDPGNFGIPVVALDANGLGDGISEIEVFADYDFDGLTDKPDEHVVIRHLQNRIEWRRHDVEDFKILAINISNDPDGNGVQPMFTPVPGVDPTHIRVDITAQSPVPDPISGEFIRYTVSADVALRKSL
jgi:prepilin-type N-terminal cleavage/methylation domain-containing protein